MIYIQHDLVLKHGSVQQNDLVLQQNFEQQTGILQRLLVQQDVLGCTFLYLMIRISRRLAQVTYRDCLDV